MKLTEAADQIRNLAIKYKSMVAVAEVLDRLGSIEQSGQEMENIRDAAEKRLNEVNAQVAAAQATLKELQEKTDAIRAAEGALAKSSRTEQDAMRKAFEDDIAGKKKELAAITDQLESARHKVATMLEFAKAS